LSAVSGDPRRGDVVSESSVGDDHPCRSLFFRRYDQHDEIALVPGNAGTFLVTSVVAVVSGGVFFAGLGMTVFHVQSSISVVCHSPLLLEVL